MIASVQPSMDASSNSSARRRCWLGVGIGAWPTHRSAAGALRLWISAPTRQGATGRDLPQRRQPQNGRHDHFTNTAACCLVRCTSIPLHVGRGTEWVVHATGAVVGRGARYEFLQGVPRLAPSGKHLRDHFYGRRSHLSEFYIASGLSLNSLPLSFEKISCFVQLPDKLRHNTRQGADRVSGRAG